jgi:hypothetical protein
MAVRHRATSNARFSIVGVLTAILVALSACGPVRYQLAVRVADELLEGSLMLANSDDANAGCTLRLRNRGDAPLTLVWSDAALIGPDHRARPIDRGPDTLAAHGEVTIVVRPPPLRLGDTLTLTLPVVIDGGERTYHFRARLVRR